MGESVEIVEMGPRDGLQNEARIISVAGKVALVDALSSVGFRRIEVASFVSPRWVPQMAGSGEVMAGIARVNGVRYGALVPNVRGFEAAMRANVDEVAVFASASEGFSRANINASIAESLERFQPVMKMAKGLRVPVRGYVSCVTDCPYDGAVAPEAVAAVASDLRDIGCFEVSLGDTLGRGLPERMDAMFAAVLERVEVEALAGHFHDSFGRALENVAVALGRGVRVFDASVAGLGSCPYAPGAAGNVATEGLAACVETAGFEHSLDMERLRAAADVARGLREGVV
ncbi:hydroxymethylglutaryl-CoA lyase [uncultured Boseongicola sp.]|uniref:hydroxymethylglutaryl-CoA lyase n=1 Tax=uncultured Boseongicola sp. TaxID=1648499 RepID=UPI00260DAB10|nr:hydroxymethylglutaryl-CoA lyase [uncultured Boseongicola sp.]